jgi:uncharacterized protein YidB (DUF937 family)
MKLRRSTNLRKAALNALVRVVGGLLLNLSIVDGVDNTVGLGDAIRFRTRTDGKAIGVAATELGDYLDSATLRDKVSSWVSTQLNYVPGCSEPIHPRVPQHDC